MLGRFTMVGTYEGNAEKLREYLAISAPAATTEKVCNGLSVYMPKDVPEFELELLDEELYELVRRTK